MIPSRRSFAIVALSASLVAVRSARADDPSPPTPPQGPPPVVQPAPPLPARQDAERRGEPLFVSPLAHGAYGAPSVKVTVLGGHSSVLAGGEGGWIIGRVLVLGGAGYGSVSGVGAPASLQPPLGGAHMTIGYGGFRLGGIVSTHKAIHTTFGVLAGGGRAASDTASGTFHRSDGFFVLEPDLSAEINLAPYVRLALGASYRFAGGTDVVGFTATRLSGPAAGFSLRFGAF